MLAATAGLIMAHHYGYIDLKAAKDVVKNLALVTTIQQAWQNAQAYIGNIWHYQKLDNNSISQ